MPAPSNVTSGAAIDIGSWPISYTQNVNDSGTTYAVWLKFTATISSMVNLLAWGGGDTYIARATLYADDASTIIYNLHDLDDLPLQFPVVEGFTYYLKVRSKNGDVADGTLTITGALPPALAVDTGDLLINDDGPGNETLGLPTLYASIVDKDDGTLKRFVPMVSGEFGDSIQDGAGGTIYGVTNDDEDPISGDFELVYYDSALAETSRPYAFTSSVRALAGNVDRFYFSDSIPLGTVKSIGRDGAIIGSWVVDATFVRTLAASRDNTILYYGELGLNNPIKRWDLVNDVALTDFADEAGFSPNFDTRVLANGNILVTWTRGGGTPPFNKVMEYLPDGTVVRTYTPTIPSTSQADGPRMTTNEDDDSSSFWLWLSGTDGAINETFIGRFFKYSTVDGSVLLSFDVIEFEHGRGPSGLSADWPTFGNPKSCPLMLMRTAIDSAELPPEDEDDTVDDGDDGEIGPGDGGSVDTCALAVPSIGCWNGGMPSVSCAVPGDASVGCFNGSTMDDLRIGLRGSDEP